MSYVEPTVEADGATDRFTAVGITAAGSSSAVSGFLTFKFLSQDAGNALHFYRYQDGSSFRGGLYTDSGDRLTFYFIDDFNTPSVLVTPAFQFALNQWYLVAYNFDSANQAGSNIYVSNNTTKQLDQISWTPTTFTSGTHTLDGYNFYCLSDQNGQRLVNVEIGDFYHVAANIDWSLQANRDKIWTSGSGLIGGCPVDRGANGELVTGSSPPIFFHGGATPADYDNKGTAGTFIKSGAVDNAPTSPSDGCTAVTTKRFVMNASNARSPGAPGGTETYTIADPQGEGNIQES